MSANRHWSRRDVVAGGSLALLAARLSLAKEKTVSTKTPILFVSHGSPMVAVEHDDYTEALASFGRQITGAKAVISVSAHWQTRGRIGVTAGDPLETVHDFGGFPDAMYEIEYPAPAAPALAKRIVELLTAAKLEAGIDEARGRDHGTWVPLSHMLPEAKVPVIQVSLPVPRTNEQLVAVGKALAPLRAEGIAIVASGGIVHNLGIVEFDNPRGKPAAWAKEFDDWAWAKAKSLDAAGLSKYRAEAPQHRLAVPTSEHFDPMFVALGAAAPGEAVKNVYDGIRFGTLSMRTFSIG